MTDLAIMTDGFTSLHRRMFTCQIEVRSLQVREFWIHKGERPYYTLKSGLALPPRTNVQLTLLLTTSFSPLLAAPHPRSKLLFGLVV